MIPETDTRIDYPEDEEDEERVKHLSHTDKRADKHSVKSVTQDGLKEVEYYTMTCPDCAGIGRYDSRGDVICDDCGMVIGGAKPTVVPSAERKETAENTFEYRR